MDISFVRVRVRAHGLYLIVTLRRFPKLLEEKEFEPRVNLVK